jgi:hypothetical protein
MSTILPSTIAAAPANPSRLDEVKRLRARAALVRKRVKTPLEDALAAEGGAKAVRLVQWARSQKAAYDAALTLWRENRRKYAQEAQDIFSHRAREAAGRAGRMDEEKGSVFEVQNDSLNIIAGLAEFAAAQCEQDIFGGDPWFAAQPVGRDDPALADELQKHLQWVFRDGRYVDSQCRSIDQAVALGECFTKTFYHIEADEYEARVPCQHIDGKPAVDKDGQYVTTDAQVSALGKFKGKVEWKEAFETKQVVTWQGVVSSPVHFNDISFREDAPELDLLHTNVYLTVEMSVAEARRRFNLSKEDALRLARCAEVRKIGPDDKQREEQMDAASTSATVATDEPLGEDEAQQVFNTRVRLIEGYILADVLGNGTLSRVCIIFPPQNEDWIIWADYLANISPKGELPVKVDVWEPVPHKLYGRGFFAKYAYVQQGTDNLWNQVQFRNAMHANPITGIHAENMMRDEDDGDLVIKPGLSIAPKANKKLGDCIEFAQLPDLDNRSMELMQIGMQMAQLRSGITSASQGDLSTVPESNTATGIKSLMSRAAVLLKKPVRRMRRSKGRAFGFAVKLYYANFDREEAFVVGEGQNAELVKITPEKVADLDIDVRMLLTQEQNQTKLEGAQVAMSLIGQWLQVPEAEKGSVRPLFLQAIKALDFDQANEIIRQPVATLEDAAALLPPEQQQRLQMLLAQEQHAAGAAALQPAGAPPPSPQGSPLPTAHQSTPAQPAL